MNNTRKPFIKGISIQVSPEMIAAMGGNPVTELAEAIRSLASAFGSDKIQQVGEHFRYRSVGGDIAIDFSLEVSKKFFEHFNSVFVPSIERASEEVALVTEAFGAGEIDVETKDEELRCVHSAMISNMTTVIHRHAVEATPTLPAHLYAH